MSISKKVIEMRRLNSEGIKKIEKVAWNKKKKNYGFYI